MYDLIIEDATIVSSEGRQVADIALKNGRIAYVGPRPMQRARETISAIGRFLMPGIIDTQVSLAGGGGTTWASETLAAVSGGVTTVLELPQTHKPRSLSARRKLARRHSHCHYGFWARATDPAAGQELLDRGAVGLSVDLSDAASPRDEDLRRLLGETRGPLGFHVEDGAVLRARSEALRDCTEPNARRPPEAAAAGVQRLLPLVRELGRAVHIFQLSTASELLLLDPIGGELPITSAVSPAHLSLSVEQHEALGLLLKCNPPVRTETDRRALWTALKRGRIDIVASAHTPLRREDKRGDYAEVPPGLPGVETTFSVMLSAVQHGRLSLERMVDLLSEAPARILGLSGKGRIQRGYDADLLLFRESDVAPLDADSLLSRSGWTPYQGRELAPKPDLVWVGGQLASRGGVPTGAERRATEVRLSR